MNEDDLVLKYTPHAEYFNDMSSIEEIFSLICSKTAGRGEALIHVEAIRKCIYRYRIDKVSTEIITEITQKTQEENNG